MQQTATSSGAASPARAATAVVGASASLPSVVQDVVPFDGCFPSWEAFDVARRAHCEKTYTMYVCRNTVKVAVANQRRKQQVPESWVYDRKVYVCTHGYKRVSRSSGSRPRQRVRFTNCRAGFTACVTGDSETFWIKITGQRVVHDDHPVSLAQWRMYSQNRAAIIEHPYLTHEAELMRRVGSNKRLARAHIETLSGKVCTMKDMHNLYARLKKREDAGRNTSSSMPVAAAGSGTQTGMTAAAVSGTTHFSASQQTSIGASNGVQRIIRVESVLQSFVDENVENHVSILSGDDGSNEAICLASRAMKEHFQAFPELLLLDVSTSNSPDDTHANQQQKLHGFLAMDALGNAKPVFLAQSLTVSPSLLRRMCQDFKRTHPQWVHTKVLVMAKLLPEVAQVLAREFPQARLLLCQFHVLKFLSELLAHAQQQELEQQQDTEASVTLMLEQQQTREALQRLVLARSESGYNESKAVLADKLSSSSGGRELLALLERDWEPYRALWTSYTRAEEFEFSSFLTKGMESFWNPLKSAFQRTESGNLSSPPDDDMSTSVASAAAAASAATTASQMAVPATVRFGISPESLLAFSTHGSSTAEATSLPVVANGSAAAIGGGGMNRLDLGSGDPRHMNSTASSGSSESLAKCISEVLAMVKFIEEEWASKMLILELTKPVASDRADPMLRFMVNCLSSFAAELVSAQLTTQSAFARSTVTITKTRAAKPATPATSVAGEASGVAAPPPGSTVSSMATGATVRWLDKTTHEKHVLQRDASACDCGFFALYQLPCRHLLWYEASVLGHKQLSMAAVGARWFLRSFQPPKLASQRESNEIEYHLL